MHNVRDTVRGTRLVAGVVLLLASISASCTHWSETRLPVESAIRAERHGRIRVTTRADRRLELQAPRIEADTLVGFGRAAEGETTVPTEKIPTSEIARVETRATDVPATIGAALLVGTASLFVLGLSVAGSL